jgi:hypothetical protein
VNSSQDSSGLRTFTGIALRETAGTAGCKPFENKVDNKFGARYDMHSRYIYIDIASIARICDPEKGSFLVTRSPTLIANACIWR